MAMEVKSSFLHLSDARPNVAARLGVDAFAAASTAFTISPVVTIIDSTIMMRAAGQDSFSTCLKRLITPISSLPAKLSLSRPSALVFAVYFGTYVTANAFDTFSTASTDAPASTITASTEKFAATAVVATGLTVYKDARLAQIFGKGRSPAVPLASLSLFTLRDAITIFASFNMPTLIAPKLSGLIESEARQLKTAQFLLPAVIQFITTPIHLLGLDLHNRKVVLGMRSRSERVQRDLRSAILARVIRILPAFGLGGVLNMSIRQKMMDEIDVRH